MPRECVPGVPGAVERDRREGLPPGPFPHCTGRFRSEDRGGQAPSLPRSPHPLQMSAPPKEQSRSWHRKWRVGWTYHVNQSALEWGSCRVGPWASPVWYSLQKKGWSQLTFRVFPAEGVPLTVSHHPSPLRVTS